MNDSNPIFISRKKGVFTAWQKELITEKIISFGIKITNQTSTNQPNKVFLLMERELSTFEKKNFINYLADRGIVGIEIS